MAKYVWVSVNGRRRRMEEEAAKAFVKDNKNAKVLTAKESAEIPAAATPTNVSGNNVQ